MSAAVETLTADAVVVGSGVAGLSAAAGFSPRSVVVLTKAVLGDGASSVWAQGGVAVALDPRDSTELHAADTVAAGAGLVDREIAELLARDGVAAVRRLIDWGAEFDRGPDGELAFGREAAHSRRRILHAHGDATGAEMVRALAAHARRLPSIRIVERHFATRVAIENGRAVGVVARALDDDRWLWIAAPRVVLATGGIGQLFLYTTNPREATGDGVALAARAGAELADLEFVQFHPTALKTEGDPKPLLSEALRGEGATLVNESGERFMVRLHPDAELAPRDVVARGIWAELAAGRHPYLDARRAVGEEFPERFPTVYASCVAAGIDPRRELLPVAPAAHYHMGGVAVDERGRTTIDGLWACGEVASTGVHGANRLASNSLLEALVWGARVAEDGGAAAVAAPAPRSGASSRPDAADEPVDPIAAAPEIRAELRRLFWTDVGLVRDARGLAEAEQRCDALVRRLPAGASEVRNLIEVGTLLARSAARRTESRGAHYRSDFPAADPAWRVRQRLTARFAGGAPRAVFLDPAPAVEPVGR
ncbi:MAG: L-aspartate oxidase [Thermoanaerobaculia bacterium]